MQELEKEMAEIMKLNCQVGPEYITDDFALLCTFPCRQLLQSLAITMTQTV